MATTYLDIMNDVLARLGEPQLPGSSTDLETDYQKLLGQMINEVKEEVEDATNWRALRQVVSVTITASSQSAQITEGNERSRLVRIFQSERPGVTAQYPYGTVTPGGGYIPLVFDITDTANPLPLTEIDLSELLWRDQMDPNQTVTYPSYFALDNSPSGDQLDFYVYPRPTASRTFQVTLCVPQARLGDGDLTTVIKVPRRPIFIGAMWYAYEERGEELGHDSLWSEKRFREALAAAVARDEAESGNQFELIVG